MCKAAGVTGVQWRISAMGQVCYQSKGAATVFPGSMPLDMLPPKEQELARVLKEIDPLEIAVREAKRQGIRLLIWMTLSDEGYKRHSIPNYVFPDFLVRNPHCMLMDRKGNPLPGTICYNEPQALQYRLNIVKELLKYGADGLYLCTRSHSSVFGVDRGDDYGFNPSIVAEYYKRYGVNILKENFDLEKWRAIKSEAYDNLFSEISKLAKSCGQEVRLGVSSVTLTRGAFLGNWGNTPVHWSMFLRKGWIDSIVSGQNMVDPYHASFEINRFREVASPNQKLYFWAQVVSYREDRTYSLEELTRQAEFFVFLGANGAIYHESVNMEGDMGRYLFHMGKFYNSQK